MTQESVFRELAKKFQFQPGYSKADKAYIPNILDEPEDEEPTDDLGDRIEQEFNERDGKLSGKEIALAYTYFTEDYQKSQNAAVEHFKRAQTEKDLLKAFELTRRAAKDIVRIKKLIPESRGTVNGIPYENIINLLRGFRRELHIAIEFPNCHKQVSPLYQKMQYAVKREDYETAAVLRDKIAAITSPFKIQGIKLE